MSLKYLKFAQYFIKYYIRQFHLVIAAAPPTIGYTATNFGHKEESFNCFAKLFRRCLQANIFGYHLFMPPQKLPVEIEFTLRHKSLIEFHQILFPFDSQLFLRWHMLVDCHQCVLLENLNDIG